MKIDSREIGQVINSLQKCGDRYVEIFQNFSNIVTSLRDNRILSSKLMDKQGSDTIDQMKVISDKLRENCNTFAKYLQEEVIDHYVEVDQKNAQKFDKNEGRRLV